MVIIIMAIVTKPATALITRPPMVMAMATAAMEMPRVTIPAIVTTLAMVFVTRQPVVIAATLVMAKAAVVK
jgi:hypothetical protein